MSCLYCTRTSDTLRGADQWHSLLCVFFFLNLLLISFFKVMNLPSTLIGLEARGMLRRELGSSYRATGKYGHGNSAKSPGLYGLIRRCR